MKELGEVDFPELFGTHLSDEDQRLLDLWDQGLDCDIISCLPKNKSQETIDSGYESEGYSYVYREHSDDESSDSDTDDESLGSDPDDRSSESETDSESQSDSDSDSDSESESSASDDEEEFVPVRELVIFPTIRKGRTARSMRVQLLKHLTLKRGFKRGQFCCEEECSVLWRWVRIRNAYRDYT